ncbi:hypothetical protein P153DRAFT_399381 [Dothidotthia symphoricarpi CBS 119687]|uniref:Uncharacterized protein n=1 Tax=Dothidotthia symphoricarpi CBS 119687 TaxID=1392245 RepID=A0A6A6A4Z8_9PLEO|nr:uncharacterized protein P153DRAFT_399381 [Dothidotthia symphoricarpi CBS 119687]KAF2126616.1 hypothetical protein P153DRAFT_399381 [Dothidotthia symphoricarpi CBS 119687]
MFVHSYKHAQSSRPNTISGIEYLLSQLLQHPNKHHYHHCYKITSPAKEAIQQDDLHSRQNQHNNRTSPRDVNSHIRSPHSKSPYNIPRSNHTDKSKPPLPSPPCPSQRSLTGSETPPPSPPPPSPSRYALSDIHLCSPPSETPSRSLTPEVPIPDPYINGILGAARDPKPPRPPPAPPSSPSRYGLSVYQAGQYVIGIPDAARDPKPDRPPPPPAPPSSPSRYGVACA